MNINTCFVIYGLLTDYFTILWVKLLDEFIEDTTFKIYIAVYIAIENLIKFI